MKSESISNFPRLLTVPEVADFLRCSTKHVYKLIANGILEASVFARSYRISEDALSQCLEKRKINHVSNVSHLQR